MKWPYGIGLDIGISSVGWAVVALDEQAHPCGIIRLGSRVFDKAEQPKTGDSLAAPRRQARSARRRLRRKNLRRQDIYALMEQSGLASREELSALFAQGHLEDIYALRTRALDEAVSQQEFARILLHISQRRGFQSNRQADSSGEDGQLLQAVSANRRRMEQNGYRTVGEMLYRDAVFAGHKRNKGEYLSTVGREEVAEEVIRLFAAQRSFGQRWASDELEAAYLSILLRQRTFDEGPGGNSPYRGGWKDKIGTCTLETESRPLRACKKCDSFEQFSLLQKINHLRLVQDGTTRALTQEERETVRALAESASEVNYARIRKALALPDELRFNDVRYLPDKSPVDCEKKYKLPPLKGTHELRKALGSDRFDAMPRSLRNEIAQALACNRSEKPRQEALLALGLSAREIEPLLDLNFSGFGHISTMACDKLIPFLEQGMTYDQACTAAGYDFRGHSGKEKSRMLPAAAPEMEEITSPVVRRAVAQTIKVMNAIIREMGESPVFVHIELARELSKTFDERMQAEKSMKDNAAENERLMKEIRETFHVLEPSGQDLVKYRLWKEQDGRCAYSLQSLDVRRLFETGYADVDHIVPYSIRFDDTRSNKVLVLAAENRQKGNRLPMQYLQGQKRDDFVVWTKAHVRSYKKRQNLLKERLSEEEQNGFRQRNLQDTQHMARFLLNYIRDHLEFAGHPAAGKQRVTALSGGVTAHLRKRWGLSKVRADGDLHHAVDAVVIACATQHMVQQISGYYHRIEGEYLQLPDGSGSVHSRTKERFPAPWPHFRDEVTIRMSQRPQEHLLKLNPAFYANFETRTIQPVFVSRMPQHKVTGAAHKETVKGVKALNEGVVTVKRPLTDLKLDKDQQIKDYFNYRSDTLLYEALRQRLIQFGGNAKKAFEEPFHKPKADGTPGPIVRKVKLIEKSSLSVSLHGGSGAADNDSMVRVDVFYVAGDGYYLVPIYVADTVKSELPNRAIVKRKSYTGWKEMSDEDFLFSLYPNDLIEVEHKKELKLSVRNKDSTMEKTITVQKMLLYYISTNISTGSISVRNHDNSYLLKGLGVKTLKSLKKYQVDVLGNITDVKKEVRQTFR